MGAGSVSGGQSLTLDIRSVSGGQSLKLDIMVSTCLPLTGLRMKVKENKGK